MKKILCAVLALAAMASCSKEYIVAENKQAIAFGEAFVDNGTRADYSTDNEVSQFLVYGTLTGYYDSVQIFKGAEVERPDDLTTGYNEEKAWLCTETQYWVPNADYNFIAVVDGELNKDTSGNYLNTINFTVADGEGNLDLLYATASAETDGNGDVEEGTNSDGLVAFTFDHLLSKVQFTVNNQMQGNYKIQVTGITVTGALEDGLYTIEDTFENSTWEATSEDKVPSLTFGTTGLIASTDSAVASATRQILPVEQTLNVTINYDIYFGDKKISKATKTGAITHEFAKKTVYNIVAAITPTNEIKFTVEAVNGWDNGGNIDLQ